MADSFVALPVAEAVALHQRAGKSDPEAVAYFNSLFTQQAECFACAQPVGPNIRIQMIVDPRDKKRMLIWPVCGMCAALTSQELRHRCLKMAKAMWPRAGVWKVQQPKYLRLLIN